MSEIKPGDVAKSLDRIAKILAGLLMKDIQDEDQIQKVGRLKQCGFSNAEIAEMLQTTAGTVKTQAYDLRSKKKRRRPAKAARKSRKL